METTFYQRHNENAMFWTWIALVFVQWNCVGDSVGIIVAQQFSQNRYLVGVIGELAINAIFLIDFLFFKKEFFEFIPLYSNVYFFIDFLAGPVALIGDIICVLFTGHLSIICCVFRAVKALSSIKARRVFSKVAVILPKVKDMFLCLFCVFFLFTYTATYLYADLFRKDNFFNSMGLSFFTMLQMMTLDGWGNIGREVLKVQNMLTASFLILFVFIMAYFFWNILIGFILDILRTLNQEEKDRNAADQSLLVDLQNEQSSPESNRDDLPQDTSAKGKTKKNKKSSTATRDTASPSDSKDYIDRTNALAVGDNILKDADNDGAEIMPKQSAPAENFNSECNENVFQERACFGSLYKKLVMGMYLLLVLDSLRHEDLRHIRTQSSVVIQMTAGMFFSLHTIFVLRASSARFQLERNHIWMMLFHILSGPVALGCDLYSLSVDGSVNLGAIFKLFKAFTATRDTVMGAIMIFPTLMPAFLGIISIIFLLATWSISYVKDVEDFFVDFNTSNYTLVQILTLDDWAAKIVKDLLKNQRYMAPFLIVTFIFIANYFFLNMMIGFSCEVFKKVSTSDFVNRKDKIETDFYETDEGSLERRKFNSLNEFKADLKYVEIAERGQADMDDLGRQKKFSRSDELTLEAILRVKHDLDEQSTNSNSTISFSFKGKKVQLNQNELQNIKFALFQE